MSESRGNNVSKGNSGSRGNNTGKNQSISGYSSGTSNTNGRITSSKPRSSDTTERK